MVMSSALVSALSWAGGLDPQGRTGARDEDDQRERAEEERDVEVGAGAPLERLRGRPDKNQDEYPLRKKIQQIVSAHAADSLRPGVLPIIASRLPGTLMVCDKKHPATLTCTSVTGCVPLRWPGG